MKKILFLLIAVCAGVVAFAQNIYQPNGTSMVSGANSYCVGAPITTPLRVAYTTCNGGTGAPVGASCQVRWYYNPTNTTTIGGSTVLASGPIPFTSTISASDTLSYTPSLSVGGNYYFFCVIEWTGGSASCGLTTGSIVTSGTQLVSIGPAPIAPAAPINICQGATTVLTNTFTGGKWTSSNPGVVAIDSTSGLASGVTVGGSFITYKLGGCYVTAFMYVNANPAVIAPTAISNICVGGSLNLTNSTPGGTWTSTTPAVASVGSASGLVSAFSAGTSTISYIFTATGCYSTKTLTVLPNPAAIGGSTNVCVGGSTTLTNATVGGSWYSSNTFRATVNAATGAVSGVSAGTVTISYILSSTGCFSTQIMTVNVAPAAITGPGQVCATASISLANGVAGGVWSSSNPTVASVSSTGVVTGGTAGTAVISYTTGGCAPATRVITVNSLPASITGINETCNGQTTTLSSSVLGGKWRSSDTLIARIDSMSGVVSGLSMGVITVTYTGAAGCYTTKSLTVHPLAPIVGEDTICVGSTIALTNIVGGGTWVSGNPLNASIDTFSGVMQGLVNGITYVDYILPTGCRTSKFVRVLPTLPPIGGPLVLCSNSVVTLSNGVTGGTWTSLNPYIAEVEAATGKVSGHTADTTTIVYKIYGCQMSDVVTVNPLPTPTLSFDWTTGKLSTEFGFAAYQWFDSSSGPIPGATNNSIILPPVYDKYYVVVTDGNGCSAPTKWFKVPLGVNDINGKTGVAVYPNPVTSMLNIASSTEVNAVISGLEGRVITDARNTRTVNVAMLPAGMYLISIFDKDGQLISVQRFVKE